MALLDDPDPGVRVRALRLVGETGRRDLAPAVLPALGEEDEAVRFAAAWSARLLGAGGRAAETLDGLAAEGGDHAAAAVDVRLATAPADEARAWLRRWTGREPVRQVAALGAAGDRSIIPWLIDRMRSPETALEAGDAFRDLFAIDFDATDLFTEVPAELGPDFASLDDGPVPFADRAAAFWDGGRGRPPPEDRPSLRQIGLRALRTAAASPGQRLGAWRRTRDYPAWS